MNMKKVISLLLVLLVALIIPNVQARTLDDEYFKTLNVSSAYVCGDYMFNIGSGFKPNLRDFMKASRSIPEGEETTLYHIFYDEDFDTFTIREIYSNTVKGESLNTLVPPLKPAYLYRTSINATNPSYIELT